MSRSAAVLCLAASLGLLSALAAAQDQRNLPPAPAAAPPVSLPGLPTPPLSGDEREILAALNGLVFVDDLALVRRDGVAANGIEVNGLALLRQPAFIARMAPYLGQPLTRRRLDEITRAVVLHYRANDRPLVDAIVPEQNISTGAVQIAVIEFRVGTVLAEGNRYFPDDRLVGAIRAKPGDAIDSDAMLADIDALNANPFRKVDLVYRRSAAPGRSDVVLRTEDRPPLRVFAGFDDAGVPLVGTNRISTGFNWGDVLGLDHELSYQLTASDDIVFGNPEIAGRPNRPRFIAHAGSYTVPLPWRDRVTIFGIYSESVPRLADFNQVGTSTQASLRYTVGLPRSDRFTEGLVLGYDFKRTNNNLEFGGQQVSNSQIEVDQVLVEYRATLRDPLGSTALAGSLFISPGGITGNNTTQAFQSDGGRAGATADYVYGQLAAERLTVLPFDITWSVRGLAQRSDAALLSSEQLGVGGPSTVRGYDQYAVQGDEGYLLVNELRLPAISLGERLLDRRGSSDQLVLLGFADLGHVSSRNSQANQPSAATLASLGLGFRYAIGDSLDARFDYGWQLRHVPGPNAATTAGGSRGHLAISLAW